MLRGVVGRGVLPLILLLFTAGASAAELTEVVHGPLKDRYDRAFLLNHMLPRDSWRPFPPAADRDAWEALQERPLNRERKAYVMEMAETLLGAPWPALPATLYMEYVRNGNRTRYQANYFDRRENLSILVLAECMEHQGRFIDEIANGIWAITEEATWCVPAHAARLKGDVLHRQDMESVDLFAAETAMVLSTALYMLEAELQGLSPALCDRVRREVMRRTIEPVERGEFGRSGWMNGGNNWAPWCASSLMSAAMFLMDGQERLADFALNMMAVVDRFANNYGEDGGCDEGPGYWNEAAGAMLVAFELLNSRTNEAMLDVYKEAKIANMGLYIERARLTGSWFANFADAAPRSHPGPAKVYRFGERVGSKTLMNEALLSMRDWDPDGPVEPPLRIGGAGQPLFGSLMEIFWIPADARPEVLPRTGEAWFPDLQVLFARESSTKDDEGLVLAAKGGHNAESHNHNDIGNFILFLDGQPGIIDIGSEEYNSKTFSSHRYEVFCMRSLGHNVPLVNGVEQAPGRQYRATNVTYEQANDSLRMGWNIEEAYPKEAGLKSLRRTFDFQRGAEPGLRVTDSFAFAEGSGEIQSHLFAAFEAKEVAPGRIAIAAKPRRLMLEYDPAVLAASVAAVPIEDEKQSHYWGERIYQITLKAKGKRQAGAYEFSFQAE